MSVQLSQLQFPENVGIVAIETYFPRTFVRQEALEEFCEVSKGKYTIGLGQESLGFVSDREDIYSMCLSAVSSLVVKSGVSYAEIGRLEVATETILDHSKSVKSVLMQLFVESGNSDVEGIDSIHACYGGTAAMFNSIAWMESRAWDGRLAMVVCGDIAEYATGPARPTGGAGVVVMLIGPNSPIPFEPGFRSSHFAHAYDFYKPRLDSPYPVVDGHFSNLCYLQSLDNCYNRLKDKAAAKGDNITVQDFDYAVFHAPYNKLVQKSFARLLYNDFMRNPNDPQYASIRGLSEISLEDSYNDRDIQSTFSKLGKSSYNAKVEPSTLLPKQLGNMYSASLWAGLASLINSQGEKLIGKRIVLFSYGSGLASSMFVISARNTPEAREQLRSMAASLNLEERLSQRIECAPAMFAETMLYREKLHKVDSFTPSGALDLMYKGAYFLNQKDNMCRRFYVRL